MLKWISENWKTLMPILLSIASFIWSITVWKKQKKLDANLARSKAAYDIILKKEFEFYEESDKICAVLIPGIQDINDSISNSYGQDMDLEKRKSIVKENFMKYLENIPILKALLISHDVYLPKKVRDAYTLSISVMQSNAGFLFNEMNKLWSDAEETIDTEKLSKITEEILLSYTLVRQLTKQRLEDIAKI